MSSSDEENVKQNGKNYQIDLSAFSASKVRLETELRNSQSTIEILDTYCTDGIKFKDVNPLTNPDGANPLLTKLYKHNTEGSIQAPWGKCSLTDIGQSLKEQMAGDGADHVTECAYGDLTEQTSLPSPSAIHHWPSKAWRNINSYYIKMDSATVITKANWKKLSKLIKKWLNKTHQIWSKIVGRLPESGMHLTGGLEMSNGVELYNRLLCRHGHTHAQCLAELLRLLTQIRLLKPDPSTKKLETIRDYFDRARRMAREAREFAQMKVPIAGPLLKVLILEGLNRSNAEKYGSMIIQAYANDLTDDIDRLQTTMETVEGLRAIQIRDEYAPTMLSTGEINTFQGTGKGNPLDRKNFPNQPCSLPGHSGHLNKECRTKWGSRAVKYRGKNRNNQIQRGNTRNNNSCRFFTSGRTCPYGDKCKYEHSHTDARLFYIKNTFQPNESDEANANTMATVRSPYEHALADNNDPASITVLGNEQRGRRHP